MFEHGFVPDLGDTETAFRFGYATLVIAGSQRVSAAPGGLQHYELLKFLIERGLPLDVPDICGHTALHHSVLGDSLKHKAVLMRLMMSSGANPNYQNRYGEVALFHAFQRNDVTGIDLLMEFNADLDIKEADGGIPMSFCLSCGPQVTAAVRRWIGKRKGEEAPRVDKKCDNCGDRDKHLKNCAKCQVARYCSVECQSMLEVLTTLSDRLTARQRNIGQYTRKLVSLSLPPVLSRSSLTTKDMAP